AAGESATYTRRPAAGRLAGLPARPRAWPVAPGGAVARPVLRGAAASGDLRLGAAAHRLVRPGRAGQGGVRRPGRVLSAAAGDPARHRQPAGATDRGGHRAAPVALA